MVSSTRYIMPQDPIRVESCEHYHSLVIRNDHGGPFRSNLLGETLAHSNQKYKTHFETKNCQTRKNHVSSMTIYRLSSSSSRFFSVIANEALKLHRKKFKDSSKMKMPYLSAFSK